MFINSIPTAQITSSIWNALARTLTADPATDAGASTLVWTHSTRTLTGFTTVEKCTASVPLGGSAVKGAYTQLIAATAAAYSALLIVIALTDGGANNENYTIDIATGAAASEVVVVPDLRALCASATKGVVAYYLPLRIQSATRVAARGANNDSASTPSTTITVYGIY